MISIQDSAPISDLIATTKLFVKIESFIKDDKNKKKPFIVTIDKDNKSIKITSNDKSTNQLFQITSDGHILSQIGNMVLDVQSDKVILDEWSTTAKSQLWVYSPTDYTIKNKASNKYLAIDSSLNLIVSSTSQQWYFGPIDIITSVINKPKKPFKSFENGYKNAYQWICTQVCGKGNDIRAHYINKPLISSFISQISLLSNPKNDPSFTDSELKSVQATLLSELNKVLAVITLFNYYQSFHTDLFSQTEAILNKLEVAAGLDEKEGEMTYGWIFTLFTGLICTVVDVAIPEVGGAVAHLILAAVDTTKELAESIKEATEERVIDPFNVAVFKLWDLLLENFKMLLNALVNIETIIITDSDKLDAIYNSILLPAGLNSLAWTTLTHTQLMTPALKSNTISLCQMLLPSKYTIYAATEGKDKPDNLEDYFSFKYNDIIYFIAESVDKKSYPSERLMDEIWKLNVNKIDFFTGRFGWNFPISINNDVSELVTPTVSNNTNIPMKVEIHYDSQDYKGSLPTYSSYTYYYKQASTGLKNNFTVTIKDLLGNTLLTFKVAKKDKVPYSKNIETIDKKDLYPGTFNLLANPKIGYSGCTAAINLIINYISTPTKKE